MLILKLLNIVKLYLRDNLPLPLVCPNDRDQFDYSMCVLRANP